MKKLLVLILSVILVFSFGLNVEAKGNSSKHTVPVEITETQLIFEDQIEVGPKGGKFNVGFAELHFKNGWLDEDELPVTFTVKLYAEDGDVYVDITPDIEQFDKAVFIRTLGYVGYIFDVATGENIYVEIPNQLIKVEHFSRYCWGI